LLESLLSVDKTWIVVNEDVLAVANSVITDPVETINHVGVDSTKTFGGGDDFDEVCDTDDELVGPLAVNDPQ
jgi:hypothetical protein